MHHAYMFFRLGSSNTSEKRSEIMQFPFRLSTFPTLNERSTTMRVFMRFSPCEANKLFTTPDTAF